MESIYLLTTHYIKHITYYKLHKTYYILHIIPDVQEFNHDYQLPEEFISVSDD